MFKTLYKNILSNVLNIVNTVTVENPLIKRK